MPQNCLIFNFKVFGLPPLHMQGLFQKNFGHNYFISELILQVFAVSLQVFGNKKMTWSYFSCSVSEK